MKRYYIYDFRFNENIEEEWKIFKSNVKKFLELKGIKMHTKGIHFGNYCIVGVGEDIKGEIETIGGDKLIYRDYRPIIERDDLRQFGMGDRVTIVYKETDFFPIKNAKGTVCNVNITDDMSYITIRGYRLQQKGWIVTENEMAEIVKGW